jgi:F-box and WD-40 domain protein MET30
MCCFSQLSLLSEQLAHLIRIDPLTILPREVCLKILGNLDATSLCRAAQVNRRWKALADDDVLWRGICEQHIGQKCLKCGWGLPVLEKKRKLGLRSTSPCVEGSETFPSTQVSLKRRIADVHDITSAAPPIKRQRSTPDPFYSSSSTSNAIMSPPLGPSSLSDTTGLDDARAPDRQDGVAHKRPWKDVYSERMTVERNWRRGRCTVRTLTGHTDGVMCLQFNETMTCPAFPVLITGSYDRTVRVWNMDTGEELRCLKGHSRAVRALQFDDAKLITGSMDHTLKVWDWRRGVCIRTLRGHTEGVVCLNFDSNVLASGGVDTTIKVWNLRTGSAFTLRGHSDWVNAVLLWDSNPNNRFSSRPSSLFDLSSTHSSGSGTQAGGEIDAGKMLFSASDDGTIRLWDLTLRSCLRVMSGHMGQVQSMKLLAAAECNEDTRDVDSDDVSSGTNTPTGLSTQSQLLIQPPSQPTQPILISGSLDNTIKLWDIETGKAVRTLFGHIEGVWGVASDKLRLVSGSHDRTIKVVTYSCSPENTTTNLCALLGMVPRRGEMHCHLGWAPSRR